MPAPMGEEGQASVEVAVLIPVLFLVVALLVQPACLLYTRAVMSGAAAQGARLAASNPSSDEAVAFVRRRLKAVPEVSVFHAGGEGVDQRGGRGLGEVEGRGARPRAAAAPHVSH